MPPLPEDAAAKMTNEDLDRIRRMAYAMGKGTSGSSSASGESVFSSLSDASSQDSQVPPPRPTEARASDECPSASKPSNPPKDSSRSTANQASRNQQAGIPGGIKIKRLPASSSSNSPPLSQPHHSRGCQQEPSETTGKDSRSKPETRTAPEAGSHHSTGCQQEPSGTTGKDSRSKPKTRPSPEAGSKEKASPDIPQPDRFDGSQARDDSHKAKASQHQASFKTVVIGVCQGFLWAVTSPFSVLRCVQGILGLIVLFFGKGTFIEVKDWVSDTAGTIAGSTKTAFGSQTAYLKDALGWDKDIPYEELPPVLPLVIHIEIWEPGLKLAVRDLDNLQPLIPDLDLGNVARKKKQMAIGNAKWLKELSSLFVSELTKSLGPSRIVMRELLWKIRHHPVKNQLDSDTKAKAFVCGWANNFKGQHDFMVRRATESGDDTSRLWLSTHDSENAAGGQAADEDSIGSSKALAGMSNTWSNVNALCETISLDEELFMEASKQMAKEITHLKKAIKNLETTQKNLKGFSDEQFDADYAGRVETKVLVELVQTWLDLTKAYYGKDSEER
ncbi:hypothetical protein CEP54_011474 [Fusarium duplospermum]|uniref:Uncharacterized protein n=1 Tax=Fusarium duplospermum TaxID=1325734 RepID=A0A428PEC0_9HYPO|nr:hypothetical protein CEP54_011474 [Fusarium duplospermum]